MHVNIVEIKVKPEHLDDFRKEMKRHLGVIRATEPGCLRFDVSVNKEDPHRFHLYEVYADDAAFKQHMESASLKQYLATTKDWADDRRVARSMLTEV